MTILMYGNLKVSNNIVGYSIIGTQKVVIVIA